MAALLMAPRMWAQVPFTIHAGDKVIPVEAVAGPGMTVTAAADGVRARPVPVKQQVWPAVYLTFAEPFDLDDFSELKVTVFNQESTLARVGVKIKADTRQGEMPQSSARIAPKSERVCTVNLHLERWVFDKDPHLKGLKRLPKVGHGSSYTLAKTHSIAVFLPLNATGEGFTVKSAELVRGGGVKPIVLKADELNPWVDRFGQARFADFPAKIRAVADFKAQYAAEMQEIAAAPQAIPSADRFGGWAAGPQLKATGFFRTEKVNGKWWLVDPDGHFFISQGMNCGWDLTPTAVSFREEYFEALPPEEGPTQRFWGFVKTKAYRNFYSDPAHVPYKTFSFQRHNLWLKYGEDYLAENYAMQARRCRAWGINTFTGADPKLRDGARIPYVTAIGPWSRKIVGAKGYWGELLDPYAPEFAESCRRACERAREAGTNEYCIGWTANNELSWGSDGASLARGVLASPTNQPARLAFVDMLEKMGRTPDTATEADLRELGFKLAERYFTTVRAAIKAVAPNHLYLGDRNDKLNPETFVAASRSCDVITVNTYDFRASVELPAGAEDKPMMVTEFHFGCYDTGYFYASLIPVKDQATRAAAYTAYMNSVFDNPRYVGAHWFCWRDQPLTGVMGESANSSCGVVSVTDIPYRELVEAMKGTARTMYQRRYGNK